MAGEGKRDFAGGVNGIPFGLRRTPGRSRVHGKVEVSAGIAPGAAQMMIFSAIGSKSALDEAEEEIAAVAHGLEQEKDP